MIKAYATLVIANHPAVGEMLSREVLRLEVLKRWRCSVQTIEVEVDSDDLDAGNKVLRALALDGEIPI